MFDFQADSQRKKEWFDAELRQRWVPAADTHPAHLHAAMHYSLFAPGKRIRPILTFASADALGLPLADVLPLAACLEMIHVFSLIHDDLPCMDDDDMRRGQATNHKVYGEALALLAGDALLTQALLPLADLDIKKYEPAAVLAVWRAILQAVGSTGMIGGQALDLASEGRTIPLDELKVLHSRKTGALIGAAVLAPAVLQGASVKVRQDLTAFGGALGLAFQIVDDILDIEGENIGKDIGSDLQNQKSTYPALLGMAGAKLERDRQLHLALNALTDFDHKADGLRALAEFVVTRKS